MNNIVIVDLGTGNLRSVFKAVKHVAPNRQAMISHLPHEIVNATHLILPGQGAIGTWMSQLEKNDTLLSAVNTRLKAGPVLGICLGLEALFECSEENQKTKCLGKLAGTVRHFSTAHAKQGNIKFKVPHMGWNTVQQTVSHPLWSGISNNQYFYFVHSYFVIADNASDIAGVTEYGVQFCAAAARDNLFAVQFHPEKSQSAGLKLIKNFVNWDGGQ